MVKRKVIVDCDPGIDDTYALAFLKKQDIVDVVMVASVAGNVELEHTTRNARGVAHLLEWDVEVCEGAAKPIICDPIIAADFHGKNGMNGYEFTEGLAPLSERSALEAYKAILEEATEKVIILAVGPLTNPAILLTSYPHLAEKIERFYIMGGGLKGGNTNMAAEFNFLADPEAASVVFKSGVPITMAGLDVTEKGKLFESDMEEVAETGNELARFLLEIAQPSFRRSEKSGTDKAFSTPHDLLTAMAITHPQIVKGKELYVEIDTGNSLARGMSIADVRSYSPFTPNCTVLLEVDQPEFAKIFKDTLQKETASVK